MSDLADSHQEPAMCQSTKELLLHGQSHRFLPTVATANSQQSYRQVLWLSFFYLLLILLKLPQIEETYNASNINTDE
jgi:hypothetical protein